VPVVCACVRIFFLIDTRGVLCLCVRCALVNSGMYVSTSTKRHGGFLLRHGGFLLRHGSGGTRVNRAQGRWFLAYGAFQKKKGAWGRGARRLMHHDIGHLKRCIRAL
jgi:hypothetical protein